MEKNTKHYLLHYLKADAQGGKIKHFQINGNIFLANLPIIIRKFIIVNSTILTSFLKS